VTRMERIFHNLSKCKNFGDEFFLENKKKCIKI
jgi:hypothetical protein